MVCQTGGSSGDIVAVAVSQQCTGGIMTTVVALLLDYNSSIRDGGCGGIGRHITVALEVVAAAVLEDI